MIVAISLAGATSVSQRSLRLRCMISESAEISHEAVDTCVPCIISELTEPRNISELLKQRVDRSARKSRFSFRKLTTGGSPTANSKPPSNARRDCLRQME